MSHDERSVVAQHLNRAAGAQLDRAVELLHVREIEYCTHDTGKASLAIGESPRNHERRATVAAAHEGLADEKPGAGAVAVINEVRAVRHVDRRRGRTRAITLDALGVGYSQQVHLRQTCGPVRERGLDRV